MFTCINTWTSIYTVSSLFAHIDTYIHAYIRAYLSIYLSIYVCIYIYNMYLCSADLRIPLQPCYK